MPEVAGRVMAWEAVRNNNGSANIGCLTMENEEEIESFRKVFERIYNSANVILVNPDYLDGSRVQLNMRDEPNGAITVYEVINRLRELERLAPKSWDEKTFQFVMTWKDREGQPQQVRSYRQGGNLGEIVIGGYYLRNIMNIDRWRDTIWSGRLDNVGDIYSDCIWQSTRTELLGRDAQEALGQSWADRTARFHLIRIT